jgi:hypothetical protein
MMTIDPKSRAKYAFARFAVLAGLVLLAALLGGCSTLNKYGIGGQPELQCKWATAEAYINDRIVGTPDAQAQLTVNRRFQDADALCTDLIKAKAAMDAYRAMHRQEAEQVREMLKAEPAEKSGL